MYSESSRKELSDTIEYEQWMLNHLHDVFNPRYPISKTIPPDRPNVILRDSGETQTYASGISSSHRSVDNIVNAIQPLIFVACYKDVDMFFEWMLEEHKNEGKINKVPRGYKGKVDELRDLLDEDDLVVPSPLDSKMGVFNRILAFYDNLRDHRNAIIHRRDFNIVSGGFRVADKYGGEYAFVNDELFILLDVVTTCIESVVEDSFSSHQLDVVKSEMNDIQFIHGRSDYSVTPPWSPRIQVPISETQDDQPEWVVNVDSARDLKDIFPDSEGFYLYIPVSTEDKVLLWDIPESALKGVDSVTVGLKSDEWTEYQFSNPNVDLV